MSLHLNLGCTLSLATAVAYSAPARAKTCGEECRQQTIDQELQEKYLTRANKACRTAISVKVHWPSFNEDKLKRWDQYSTRAYCGEPLRQITMICAAPKGREVVKAKVKQLECRWSKTEDKPAVTLAGGALTYSVAFEIKKHYVFVQGKMEKLLGYKYPFAVGDPYQDESY